MTVSLGTDYFAFPFPCEFIDISLKNYENIDLVIKTLRIFEAS